MKPLLKVVCHSSCCVYKSLTLLERVLTMLICKTVSSVSHCYECGGGKGRENSKNVRRNVNVLTDDIALFI